jgi:hypothetical protein
MTANEQLQNILSDVYVHAEWGWDEEETVGIAKGSLHDLVSEMISRPIHEAAMEAAEHDSASNLGDEYLNGVANALYWALSKIDIVFGREENDD